MVHHTPGPTASMINLVRRPAPRRGALPSLNPSEQGGLPQEKELRRTTISLVEMSTPPCPARLERQQRRWFWTVHNPMIDASGSISVYQDHPGPTRILPRASPPRSLSSARFTSSSLMTSETTGVT